MLTDLVGRTRDLMPSRKAPEIIGYLDGLDRGVLRGWVFDLSRPTRRLSVDVVAGGVFLGQTTVGFHRPDLESGGLGDGRYQFVIHLPELPDGIAADDLMVTVSQHPTVRLTTKGVLPGEEIRGDAVAGLAEMLGSQHDGGSRRVRASSDALTGAVEVFDRPVSSFARHIAVKFGFCAAAGWTPASLDAFLVWYFTVYAVAKNHDRLPLSDAEIAFWSEIVGPGTCRAAATFAPRRGRLSTLAAAYAWAIEDSRRLWVEDAFVDPSVVLMLKRTSPLRRSFPLSAFMQIFMRENARLSDLPTGSVAARQNIYAIVMLRAIRAPHLLVYMPSAWLKRMVGDGRSASPFEASVARIVGRAGSMTVEQYRGALADQGFDLDRQSWFAGPGSSSSRPGTGVAHRFDVQIIGPFRRTLGLGESCRRLASAIASCGLTVNCVDYDLGNASQEQPAGMTLQPAAASRITILHLNLEEVPEAYASLEEAVSGSRLVAIPYFELSAVAESHRLGLKLVEEVWAASTFLRGVFASSGTTTCFVGMPVDATLAARSKEDRRRSLDRLGYGGTDVVFVTTSDALSWVQRKNVFGTVDAFQAAFSHQQDVHLVIKTHNLAKVTNDTQNSVWSRIIDRAAKDHRIRLIDETMSEDDYHDLIGGADCLVSLHRAEGLGLDILDAMTMGTAVVATAYSGNSDFCTSETSWPVAFDLVAVQPGGYAFAEPGHVWAEPVRACAIEALLSVYNDPAERERRVAKARHHVLTTHSRAAIARRIGDRLDALRDAGER